MFFKISEISYDGEHWFKADTGEGCVIEADDIVPVNPMKAVKTKELPTRKVFGNDPSV